MARRVSLIRSQLEELPVNPKCEGISTLFLQLNPNLRIIEELFFRRMKNLRVLDLHSTGIKLLPPSISNLTSLRGLYLNNCCDLTVLPPEIVKLKKLEVLDIRGTSTAQPIVCPKRSAVCLALADQLNKLEELTIVLVNGSNDGIVDRIKAEVLEFENKNNQFKLILHRPSQSVDQGNLVQLKGQAVYLPNPSVPASHVHDPTTGNCFRDQTTRKSWHNSTLLLATFAADF
nr:disease resistance protein RPS5-like [Coffea arabica]